MTNAISWFEIPVQDLPRAQRFYETVLGAKLKPELFFGLEMAIFTRGAPGAVGGALVKGTAFRPSADGAVVYLDTGAGLDAALARVEAAGGKVVLPRTDIGGPGFIALVVDTEGNRVGLHQAREAVGAVA
jgi:predicted enzyme related to lactoylglutathione lyase